MSPVVVTVTAVAAVVRVRRVLPLSRITVDAVVAGMAAMMIP